MAERSLVALECFRSPSICCLWSLDKHQARKPHAFRGFGLGEERLFDGQFWGQALGARLEIEMWNRMR